MSASAAATLPHAHRPTPRRRALLAPDILDVVEDAEAAAAAPAHTMTPAELRAAHDREAAALAGPGPRLASVGDLVVPGPHGWLPMRAYAPVRGSGLPVVAYFHGGGWTVGSIATFDAVARELATASRALVVSVGYRLAPEHPFPVPVDEAVAAIRWLAANARVLGGDGSRLAVAGDSSGANLAAVAARRLRDEGEAYGAALRAASVRATIRRYPGTVHGFWRWLARSRAAGRAVGEVGAALRAALTDPH
jgi:acetyl esterase